MSVLAGAVSREARAFRVSSFAATPRAAHVAWLGTCLLLVAAPFEALQPLVRLPGQSLSGVETVLLVVLATWLGLSRWSHVVPVWRTPLTWPWIAFGLAALIAALLSADPGNALHMTGRFWLAFGVYLLTLNGVTSIGRLRGVIIAAAVAGAIVALLVVLEYVNVGPVMDWLTFFRANAVHVGAQVRAAGPFQYPTIASMYLEIAFALTLGLLMAAVDSAHRGRTAGLTLLLVGIGQAITLTFTRAGLITMSCSLVIVALWRVRQRGADRGLTVLALVAIVIALQFLTSRSVESLRLRLTSEGQNAWYHASIDAPAHLTLQAGSEIAVPVSLTNTGSSSWDPHALNRFRFSYHWLLPDEDRVVSWEGARTDFPAVVPAGSRVDLQARVVAPRQPGQYRLLWDIEQEHQLWFSTEPDADVFFSLATVSGPATGTIDVSQLTTLPKRAVRPGRLVLWSAAGRMLAAHPILGVGPDNFRLGYASYAGLPGADTRVHSNNMYLEVLAGGGILAGSAFLWLLWSVAICVRRLVGYSGGPLDPLASGIVAAAAAIALHGLVDSFLGFTATYIFMAIALGLIVGSQRLPELRRAGHEAPRPWSPAGAGTP
jgi:hypothetical protein